MGLEALKRRIQKIEAENGDGGIACVILTGIYSPEEATGKVYATSDKALAALMALRPELAGKHIICLKSVSFCKDHPPVIGWEIAAGSAND